MVSYQNTSGTHADAGEASTLYVLTELINIEVEDEVDSSCFDPNGDTSGGIGIHKVPFVAVAILVWAISFHAF